MPFLGRRNVELVPGIRFGHEHRDEREWELLSITHIRPEDDQEPERFDLFCAGCHDDTPLFVLRIHSMKAARIKRYGWGFNALVAFVIFAFGLVTFERIRDEGFPIVIGCFMLIYALRRWWNEDGVEICTRQRGHRLMWR